MADEFIGVPIEVDPDALMQDAFDFVELQLPDWLPSEGNFEVILLETVAQMASEVAVLASDVPTAIFRWFGATLVGIPPIDAAPASAPSTWTVQDAAGYTITAGTVVGIPATGDDLVAFAVVDDVVIAPAATATATGEVILMAVEPGADGENLTGTPQLIDPISFVTGIVLESPTAGGVDAEDDDVYLDRLASQFQLLAPRPILPRDFALMARSSPGVWRALAIDGYNPTGPLTGQEKTISVAVVDEFGNALAGPQKAAVDTLLQSNREVNFEVFILDPTYTNIDVTVTAHALPEFDIVSVDAAVEAALADYLSPATWGQILDQSHSWLNVTKVRYLELAAVVNSVDGIDYIDTLTFRVAAGTMATTDVTLTGAAPLVRPGTIAATVSAP